MATGGEDIQEETMTQYVPKKGFFSGAKQKPRRFVLTACSLQCEKVSTKGTRETKLSINLTNVTAVEELDDVVYAFQVAYQGKEGFNALYIVCDDAPQRRDWIKRIRDASKRCGADFRKKYHPGVYDGAKMRYTCCSQSCMAAGCRQKTSEKPNKKASEDVSEKPNKKTSEKVSENNGVELRRNTGGGSVVSLSYRDSTGINFQLDPRRMVRGWFASLW